MELDLCERTSVLCEGEGAEEGRRHESGLVSSQTATVRFPAGSGEVTFIHSQASNLSNTSHAPDPASETLCPLCHVMPTATFHAAASTHFAG